MKLLGIDCSCDDTSVAIVEFDNLYDWRILGDVRIGQESISTMHGGVIPEVSSRLHLKNIQTAFDQAMQQANVSINDIDGFCATFAPGLLSSLVIGYNFAFTLSKITSKPFVPCHHIESHLLVAVNAYIWPFIAIIVSGGHSIMLLCKAFGDYEIICESLDDAIGEVFDKVARAMGLGFPGGPYIEQLAKQSNSNQLLTLPCRNQLRWSFSGLKTQCLRMIGNESNEDICMALQNTIVASMKEKMRLCIEKTGVNRFLMCGGVASNMFLRESLKEFNVQYPAKNLCVDNGVMIAVSGFYHLFHKTSMVNKLCDVGGRLSLTEFIKNFK